MENSIILHNLSPSDLMGLLSSIQEKIFELENKFTSKKHSEEYLTRYEVADLLKCDLSTVHNMTKRGDLTCYGFPGSNRVYYKRNELDSAMVKVDQKKAKKH